MKSKCLLFFLFAQVVLYPLASHAVPTIDSARCTITNELRDGSSSTGALEDTMCLLRVGFAEGYTSASDGRNSGGEEIFGCLVSKGESTCEFAAAELQALNAVLQDAGVNPRLRGEQYQDRGPLARRFGCLQVTGGDRATTSPFVIPSPKLDTGNQEGSKCLDNENCSLEITYQYTCLTLPEPPPPPEDPAAFPQCRAEYQACVAENLRLQVELGTCRDSIAISVPLTDFAGGLAECTEHLGSCRLSNFQLGAALLDCTQ